MKCLVAEVFLVGEEVEIQVCVCRRGHSGGRESGLQFLGVVCWWQFLSHIIVKEVFNPTNGK